MPMSNDGRKRIAQAQRDRWQRQRLSAVSVADLRAAKASSDEVGGTQRLAEALEMLEELQA